ncbi:unnamed protein product [Owenia fusiformis]|uniref:Uncharacterized protein n=1 Tax=Owenia fusiformis TaxID=6347 RepID=A0A8J1U9V7_OWEFU|nr:unnamed protein product [Owenia fusiformis]
MSVITHVPEPNLWDEICKEFSSNRPPWKDDDAMSVHTELQDYDPAMHNPVFYGKMHKKQSVDENPIKTFDPSKSHPSCVGYAFMDKPPPATPPRPPTPPDKDTCPPREYLEHYIFPYLLPGMELMLAEAKREKCFERRRTKFNALDFLTEHLYKNNPKCKAERKDETLLDIPFVKEWLKDHPRAPLPLSLLWTDEEAAVVVQAGWRGYLVRKDEKVQELRQWQRQWRDENTSIQSKVDQFWATKMPNGGLTPAGSIIEDKDIEQQNDKK